MKSEKYIEESVQRLILAMAYNRETFKDKVEEYISGALLGFYKARLARKEGKTKWIQHWETEARNLINLGLTRVIKHEVRGFRDREKAINSVILSIKKKDMGYRRCAEHAVKTDYDLWKLKKSVDDKDTEDFWSSVNKAVNVALQFLKYK